MPTLKSYLEVGITATESERELLIPTMIELGCRGFQETDTELLCYFEEGTQQINGLKDGIGRVIRTISSNADLRFRTIVEENWNEQWERTVQPIEIGKRIVIKPSWAEYDNKDNRTVIQIDPKMSFGTGYHETTRLELRLIEGLVDSGYSMLDVGTGTGILAIAAVKLGATRAVAIDNDPWSIENAKENVEANSCSERIRITDQAIHELTNQPTGQLINEPTTPFHLITANLTLNTIIELLPDMVKVLERNGTLILSGLLQNDVETVRRELSLYDMEVLETLSENEWVAVAARRQKKNYTEDTEGVTEDTEFR